MAIITTQTAQEMAAKAHEARRRNAALRELQEELAEEQTQPEPQAPLPEDYVSQQIVRVRAQLAKLDAMLVSETDPQKIDRLAAAFARLAEVERQLDGRPLPGSRRPGKERAAATPPIVPL